MDLSQEAAFRTPLSHVKINTIFLSVAESEPPGAATLRMEPEPHFLRRLRLHLFDKQKKESLVVVTKNDLRAIYNGKCDPKKTSINTSLFKSSK